MDLDFYVITREHMGMLFFWSLGGGWGSEINCVRYRDKVEAEHVTLSLMRRWECKIRKATMVFCEE